ncbi:MAG TPA: hypothetical protein VMM54_12050 [Nitrospirota bacterium]|nr:hypothetical protein [Nitrospirota bacterium]
MIFNVRFIRMLMACFTLTAISLMCTNATVKAGDAGYAPSVQSEATGTFQGKIPFPRPESHKGNWIEFHGASANLNINEAGQSGKSCLTCHEWNDCITCHNTRMPRDHTNTWRTLSHGFMAEGNRERCLTCHKQDYCVRCHNETPPRTHVGNWVQRHCTWCHYSGSLAPADNCVVCHKVARHTSAPHPVSPNLNCGLCHKS